MPNAKVLSEKQAIVASLTEKLRARPPVSSSIPREHHRRGGHCSSRRVPQE